MGIPGAVSLSFVLFFYFILFYFLSGIYCSYHIIIAIFPFIIIFTRVLKGAPLQIIYQVL